MASIQERRPMFEAIAALFVLSVFVTVSGQRNTSITNSNGNCLPDHYPCNNGRCITYDHVCNGFDNCGDSSDEKHGCYHSDERYWWKSVVGIVIAACLVIAAASCYIRKRFQIREGHRFANRNSYPPAPLSTLPRQSCPRRYSSSTPEIHIPEYNLWTTQSPILPPPYSKEDKEGIPSIPPPPYTALESEPAADTGVTRQANSEKNNDAT